MKDYIVLALILIVFLAPFIFAYYKDYKNNPVEFIRGLKGMIKLLLLVVCCFFTNKIIDLIQHFFN